MVWRIGGLDTDEPHLYTTRFATREAHRPRLPNYLKRSHATRPRLLLFIFSTAQATAHLKNTYNPKKVAFSSLARVALISRDQQGPLTGTLAIIELSGG